MKYDISYKKKKFTHCKDEIQKKVLEIYAKKFGKVGELKSSDVWNRVSSNNNVMYYMHLIYKNKNVYVLLKQKFGDNISKIKIVEKNTEYNTNMFNKLILNILELFFYAVQNIDYYSQIGYKQITALIQKKLRN